MLLVLSNKGKGMQSSRALSVRPNIPLSSSGYSMRRMEQYFPLSWTNQSQIIRFQVSRENTRSNGGLFHLCLLALGLFDDSEVEINDVLGEGDNITFIVRIWKSATTFTVPFSFLDEFKSHFRMTSKLFTRAVILTFHVRKLCIFALLTKACEANHLQ